MVFKLVRTDSEDPYKIQLPVGTHLIGRGKFLDCDDKRVSRKHGELGVADDAISIKALHQNPCFFIKKGSDETHILKQDCTVNLSHGDKFGLLPNSHWYELLHCSGLDVAWSPENTNEENTQPLDQTITTTEPAQNGLEITTNDEQLLNCDIDKAVASSQCPESPSLLPPVSSGLGSPSLTPRESSPIQQSAPVHSSTQSTSDAVLNEGSPLPKRSHSPEDSKDEVKKIKVEPDVKQEPGQQDPDVRPGPSGDQAPSSNGGDGAGNNVPGMPPSPAKPAPPGRERCIYGASCYRRNPQHKAQFAHPADADWGTGARGVCPFGGACRKRDPRHWTSHEHPPGTHPPHNQPGMQVVERHGNIFYINAHSVNFYDDHFQVEDSDGDSVDYDYEF